ncbi:MAG: carboxypeptidase-like regulatory domain-containing protein [Caldilineaceae bacterium]
MESIFTIRNEVTTDINGELVPGGLIQGRVTDESGRGLDQITIDVYTRVGSRWRKATPPLQTDETGAYKTSSLYPGKYRIQFRDPFFRYISRYYGDSYSLDFSPDITVRAGATRWDVNVVMTTTSPQLQRFYLPLVTR